MVAAIALIALIIHSAIVEGSEFNIFDIFDIFFEEFGWVTVAIIGAIGGIIFGFIAWIWWAMLLITIALIPITIVVAIIIYRRIALDREEDEKERKKVEIIKTSYECKNCGAKILQKTYTDDDDCKKVVYYCEHCGSMYTKEELSTSPKKTKTKTNDRELDDWEEEYFKACEIMEFKPYNMHTEKQIDRKRDRLQDLYDEGEYEYEDEVMDTEEALDYATEFLCDNENEIQDYLEQYTLEEIKKRYEYYLSLVDEEDDDEDDEDEDDDEDDEELD